MRGAVLQSSSMRSMALTAACLSGAAPVLHRVQPLGTSRAYRHMNCTTACCKEQRCTVHLQTAAVLTHHVRATADGSGGAG